MEFDQMEMQQHRQIPSVYQEQQQRYAHRSNNEEKNIHSQPPLQHYASARNQQQTVQRPQQLQKQQLPQQRQQQQQPQQRQQQEQPQQRQQQQSQQRQQHSKPHSEVQHLRKNITTGEENSSQMQMRNIEEQHLKEAENLQLRLTSESNKIIQWQTRKEIECRELERKLKESEEISQKQRKNLLELQMNCEHLTQAYQNEMKNREDLDAKIVYTRQICSILQDHYQEISTTLQSFLVSRDSLTEHNAQMMEKFDKLSGKLEDFYTKYNNEVRNLKALLTKEREQRVEDINKANKIQELLQSKLDEVNVKLSKEYEAVQFLKKELTTSKDAMKKLTEVKEKLTQQFQEKCSDLKEQLDKAMAENKDLLEEVKDLKITKENFFKLEESHKILVHEKEKVDEELEISHQKLNTIEDRHLKTCNSLEKIIKERNDVICDYNKLKEEFNQITNNFEEGKILIGKLYEEITTLKNSLSENSEELKTLQAKYDTSIAELKNILEITQEEKAVVEVRLREYEESNCTISKQLEESCKHVKDLEEKNAGLNENATTNEKELENLKIQLEELKVEKDKSEELLNEKEKYLTEVKVKLGETKIANEHLENKIHELREEVTKATNEGCRKVKEMLTEVQECTLRFNSQTKIHEEEKKKLETKIESITESLKEANSNKDLAKAEAQSYKDIIQQLEQQLNIMTNEVKKLEKELAETKTKPNSTPLTKTEEKLNPPSKVQTEMSPKSILKAQGIDANVSRKRVAFEDWSDTTDDSSVDINSYFAKKDNRKKSTSINGSDKEKIFQSHPQSVSKKVCPDDGTNLSQYSKNNSTTYQMKKTFIRNNSAPKKFFKKAHHAASESDDLFA